MRGSRPSSVGGTPKVNNFRAFKRKYQPSEAEIARYRAALTDEPATSTVIAERVGSSTAAASRALYWLRLNDSRVESIERVGRPALYRRRG